LDGAKILLAEKRAVIDDVYARAAKQLGEMNEHDLLSMTKKLLEEYAEDGDEIVFADGYPCVKQVSTLDVVKDRHLKITFVGKVGGKVDGGFMLCGKTSDKDLSFAALLAADRAQHETEIAAELFKK
jgi:vacuolar-type H+-ATPase subunit E/Vma4